MAVKKHNALKDNAGYNLFNSLTAIGQCNLLAFALNNLGDEMPSAMRECFESIRLDRIGVSGEEHDLHLVGAGDDSFGSRSYELSSSEVERIGPEGFAVIEKAAIMQIDFENERVFKLSYIGDFLDKKNVMEAMPEIPERGVRCGFHDRYTLFRGVDFQVDELPDFKGLRLGKSSDGLNLVFYLAEFDKPHGGYGDSVFYLWDLPMNEFKAVTKGFERTMGLKGPKEAEPLRSSERDGLSSGNGAAALKKETKSKSQAKKGL